MTSDNGNHLETLQQIRSLMERSSRFISLSGLSGVAAGIFALIGAYFAHLYTGASFSSRNFYFEIPLQDKWGLSPEQFFFIDAGLVLALSLGVGFWFTFRKAKKSGQKIWDKTTFKLLTNLFLPLIAGGIFCLILAFQYGLYGLVAPATLVFYGLALINGSHHTVSDIKYLGMTEIVLGLIGLYFVGYGLLIWAIGFGVLHIVYGAAMYFKYDR